MLYNTSLHQAQKISFGPEVLEKEKLSRPITRSSTRKKIQVEETKS
jgi:hypothetical protein